MRDGGKGGGCTICAFTLLASCLPLPLLMLTVPMGFVVGRLQWYTSKKIKTATPHSSPNVISSLDLSGIL